MASDPPDGIVLRRDRDLEGRGWHIWVRRGLLLVPLAFVVLALANVFGQHPAVSVAHAAPADLEVTAPTRVRGGLLVELRIVIRAHATLTHARLVLRSGWLEGITINTVEPTPESETSRNGDLQLDLGPVAAGTEFVQFVQVQVNPVNVGHRSADVELLDGDRPVATVHRTLTVLP